MSNHLFLSSKHHLISVSVLILALVLISGITTAATTISTDISTGGSISVTGTSTFMGNVGVGTSTPNWNLQIAGTLPSITLSDMSAASGGKHWVLSSMGSNFYITTSTDAYATSTVPVMTISNSGNVAIGTTTAVSQGPFSVFSNSNIVFTTNRALNNQTGLGLRINAISSIDNVTTGFGSGLAFGMEDSANSIFQNAAGINSAWENAVTPNRTAALVFSSLKPGDTAYSEKMRITGIGYVGIGTASPTSQFQVATSTSNATTSVEFGRTGQNKGSCLVMYDTSGNVQYVSIQNGSLVVSSTSCK